MPSLYVDRVLTDGQINEFAERGFVLVPQVVQGGVLARAAQRIDAVVANVGHNEVTSPSPRNPGTFAICSGDGNGAASSGLRPMRRIVADSINDVYAGCY